MNSTQEVRIVSAKVSLLRHRWLRAAMLLTLLAAAASTLHAQFQPPTDEELKMTADPKAPGAAAVYLYREEITNDPDNFHSYYVRIKVLTEKGKELATVRIPYVPGADKITKIEGRTIHADGTVIPLTIKPDDLVDFKTKGYQENSVVFTLPEVDVGSILEYRYRYSGNTFAPTWWIQQPYFVHRAHYSFHPNLIGSFDGVMYAILIGSGEKVVKDKKGYFTLDIADVPPAPDEEWMPPLNTLLWRVEFYYTQVNSAKEFWDGACKKWAEWVRDFTNPSSHLKKAVAEIVAPADTDEQKAAKIYASVQKLENTRFTRTKSEAERKKEKLKDIENAEDVWKQQRGTDDEIALLYVALARAAGLTVWPVQVVNRSRAFFDSTYLSSYQLDDYIVVVELGGKDIYLDPGQKMCPFGSLSWKHAFASGLRLTEKGAVIATVPAISYKESVIQQIAALTVDETGNLKGMVRVVMTGPEALRWRQLALENDEIEVKKQFIELMRDDLPEGVQADFDHFLALDDPSVNLVATVNVSGNLGSATGKHFFLPGLFFETRAKHPFVAQNKRVTPIDLRYPRMEQDEVVYYLPHGYTVENAPQTSDVTWPNHAMLRIASIVKDNSVEVQRSFARNFLLLDPKEYNDLHDFYLKVAAADQQQLVLTRTPVAKGN
jgi:transglutaminase-like putative cysteine protease